jgi:hypothetical protein
MKTNTQKRRNAAKVSHFTKINQYRMQSQWKDESIFPVTFVLLCMRRRERQEENQSQFSVPTMIKIGSSYNDNLFLKITASLYI